MPAIPTLYTPRLVLRPFTQADAKRVQLLAGDIRVAATTARIPHPYPDGAAEAWIARHRSAADSFEAFPFAITLAGTRTPNRENDITDTGHLIGAVGIDIDSQDVMAAELGYWLGVQYWNKGFATEASAAILRFAFERLGLQRLNASHLAENPASGRVMQKVGFTRQPGQRSIEKDGAPRILYDYLLTRDNWSARQRPNSRTPTLKPLTLSMV